MVRLRDATDTLVMHVSSIVDGSDGISARPARAAMIGSLRHSGDPRLVPALVGIVDSRITDLLPEAARALARVDDPRAHPPLAAAYERSVVDTERAILAGALGILGDVRGRDYVRSLLSSDDERVLLAAVEAMESLATREDAHRLVPLLERGDPVLLSHVIRALGRAGDTGGLVSLGQLQSDAALSALHADVEDAEAGILALMELRGEEAPEETVAMQLATASRSGAADRRKDPVVVRVTSWWDFAVGHLWLALGGGDRAVSRFERAASRRVDWAAPIAALALFHARGDRAAQALTAFRRALEADRIWVERNTLVVRAMARVFLRRAEEVERSGRVDIARGLINEVLVLDLRRVSSELRFELTRRQEQLRLRSGA